MGLPWLSECSDVSSVCPCSIWEAPGNSPALCERCKMGMFLYSFLPLQRAQNLQICFREWGKIPSVSNQRRPWSLQSKVLFTHTKKMSNEGLGKLSTFILKIPSEVGRRHHSCWFSLLGAAMNFCSIYWLSSFLALCSLRPLPHPPS